MVGLLALGVACALVLNVFRSNMVFYFSPSDVAAKKAPLERSFRIGGLVEPGSVRRESENLTVQFRVTDTVQHIPVVYTGLLPDLFREGKGVVAQGKLGPDGVFKADQVLAKHDENYMPPEAAQALKDARRHPPVPPSSEATETPYAPKPSVSMSQAGPKPGAQP
jgi:cytochrome c-type biogenesis protein CcmE